MNTVMVLCLHWICEQVSCSHHKTYHFDVTVYVSREMFQHKIRKKMWHDLSMLYCTFSLWKYMQVYIQISFIQQHKRTFLFLVNFMPAIKLFTAVLVYLGFLLNPPLKLVLLIMRFQIFLNWLLNLNLKLSQNYFMKIGNNLNIWSEIIQCSPGTYNVV